MKDRKLIKVQVIGQRVLRVNEGDHNIACSAGHSEALVPVSEASRMHEGPPEPGLCHAAVVAQEVTPTALQGRGRERRGYNTAIDQ